MIESKSEKVKTSYRLKPKIKALIVILSEKLSISQTAVITLAVLYFADKEEVNINDK
jgi:hypothetical protein